MDSWKVSALIDLESAPRIPVLHFVSGILLFLNSLSFFFLFFLVIWICCHGRPTISLTRLSENDFFFLFQPGPLIDSICVVWLYQKAPVSCSFSHPPLTGEVESQDTDSEGTGEREMGGEGMKTEAVINISVRYEEIYFLFDLFPFFFPLFALNVICSVYSPLRDEMWRCRSRERGEWAVMLHSDALARLHRTNRRRNPYRGDVHSKSHTTRHASDREQEEFVSL